MKKIISMIGVITIISLTSIILSFTIAADDNCQIRTIYVDDDNIDGPWDGSIENPFQFIQNGITASVSGDIVFVLNGVYNENIMLNKSITLQGTNPNDTVINGNKQKDTVTILENQNTISGFTIINGGNVGIHIYSDHNHIDNCTVLDNYIGIYFEESNSNIVTHCNSSDNSVGIRIKSSDNNHIVKSSFYYNTGGFFIPSAGILISSGQKNIVNTCIFSQNEVGISLGQSINNTLINNQLYRDGVSISGDTPSHFIHHIENNTVNNKPLVFYLNQNNMLLDMGEVGQMILVHCTNFSIIDACIINTSIGIETAFCTNISVMNASISNCHRGIFFYNTTSSKISDCTLVQNNNGIDLINSDNNSIKKNTVSAEVIGIKIKENSTDNIISHSDIFGCDRGIKIYQSSNNKVVYSNIFSNKEYGIRFFDSKNCEVSQCNVYLNENEGIILHTLCDHNKIESCNISKNEVGIHLIFSKENTVSNCTFEGKYPGVFLDYRSDFNDILTNNFIENEQHGYFYNSFFNRWNNNYWNEWNGYGPWIIKGRSKYYFPLFNFDWNPAKEPYAIIEG